jgi:hypothetical protein
VTTEVRKVSRYYFSAEIGVADASDARMREVFALVADRVFERDDVEDADVSSDSGRGFLTISMEIPSARDAEDAFSRAWDVVLGATEGSGATPLIGPGDLVSAHVASVPSLDERALGASA